MKRLLLPLLAAIALPTNVNANVDPKIAEFCMKAADFSGCVETMSGKNNSNNSLVSDKKQALLKEIKKIPSRIANTSLRDYSSRTLNFTDTFALTSAEDVGPELYNDAKKLSITLDFLYDTWRRRFDIKAGSPCTELGYCYWNVKKNQEMKSILDNLYGVNTIDIRCEAGPWGVRYGQDFLNEFAEFTSKIAKNIGENGKLVLDTTKTEGIVVQQGVFCKGDPRIPKKVKKEKTTEEKKKPVKINCKSAVWKNKPVCNK